MDKFRIGDRVVVVEDARTAWPHLEPYRGQSGVVFGTDDEDGASEIGVPFIFGVRFDELMDCWFFPDELELIEESADGDV